LLLDQLRAVVPYETATLWLRQEGFLQVTAASGFADNESRIGLSVAVEDSRLLQEMIATGRAISVTDVRRDQRFTNLLEPDHLSWLGIPLISKSKVTGVIALEKREGHFYTESTSRLRQPLPARRPLHWKMHIYLKTACGGQPNWTSVRSAWPC
jgi:GAF domain-containing protein